MRHSSIPLPSSPLTGILVAGQDATEAFFSLHLSEVLQRPQYQRLQVGVIEEEQVVRPRVAGDLSKVPYGEPTWLTPGFKSPYFKEVRTAPLSVSGFS